MGGLGQRCIIRGGSGRGVGGELPRQLGDAAVDLLQKSRVQFGDPRIDPSGDRGGVLTLCIHKALSLPPATRKPHFRSALRFENALDGDGRRVPLLLGPLVACVWVCLQRRWHRAPGLHRVHRRMR